MGRKLVLTGTKLTDRTAPILPDIDVILPKAGAIMFFDPSHPYQRWPAGAPLSGVMPNLAFDQFKAMKTDANTAGAGLAPVYGAAWDGVVNRSAKGGLHIVSKSVATAVTAFKEFEMRAGSDITAYLDANKSHAYYTATWGRNTRTPQALTNGGIASGQHGGDNKGAFTFFKRPGTTVGDTQYPTGAQRLGHEGINVNGPMTAGSGYFQDIAVSSIVSTALGSTLSVPRMFDGEANKSSGAFAFYGFYMEDLTVSGRSYDEAHTAAKAKYTKDVLTPGGRYYADTFTDANF